MNDLRTSDRVPTSLRAWIVSGGEMPPLACLIKDVSETGAKIQVEDALNLPPDFELEVENGKSFRAEIRWRYAHTVGVRFLGPNGAIPGEPTRAELMAENKKLREAVETLSKRLTQLGERVAVPIELMRCL